MSKDLKDEKEKTEQLEAQSRNIASDLAKEKDELEVQSRNLAHDLKELEILHKSIANAEKVLEEKQKLSRECVEEKNNATLLRRQTIEFKEQTEKLQALVKEKFVEQTSMSRRQNLKSATSISQKKYLAKSTNVRQPKC